jgi:hypothetical protein
MKKLVSTCFARQIKNKMTTCSSAHANTHTHAHESSHTQHQQLNKQSNAPLNEGTSMTDTSVYIFSLASSSWLWRRWQRTRTRGTTELGKRTTVSEHRSKKKKKRKKQNNNKKYNAQNTHTNAGEQSQPGGPPPRNNTTQHAHARGMREKTTPASDKAYVPDAVAPDKLVQVLVDAHILGAHLGRSELADLGHSAGRALLEAAVTGHAVGEKR